MPKTEKKYETRWTENGEPKSERFDTREQAFGKMDEILANRFVKEDGTWNKEFLGVWNLETPEERVAGMRAAAKRA